MTNSRSGPQVTEYLTVTAQPPREWVGALQAQAEAGAVALQLTPFDQSGRAQLRLTMHGEAARVAEVRNWAVRECYALGLGVVVV